MSWGSWLLQAVIAVVVIGIVGVIALSIRHGMASHGIGFSFSFLDEVARFRISEGRTISFENGSLALAPYAASDAYWQAFVTGLYNTIRIAVIGIALSSIVGIVVGAGRLSSNWLVNRLCLAFVELIRNTPLLIQLFFWYFAVVLQLPPISQASNVYGSLIASQQGLYLPAPITGAGWENGQYFIYAGIVIAFIAWWNLRLRYRFVISLLPLAILWAVAALIYGNPVALSFPEIGRFHAQGGLHLSPEFVALLSALVIYTGAFIAEIVRGAIQSVHKGQREAALSLGLGESTIMRIIILPQALRVIIPPVGNQYINLTKNTSLAIAVGYPDLFNVYGTIANQSGRSLEGILIIMAGYLLLNWVISGLVNRYNKHVIAKGVR